MANPIPRKMATGTIGELLVQLRLLQYDVQAAPPIKDSGNDLIAARGMVLKTIQVKATTGNRCSCNNLPKLYHLLALVFLRREKNDFLLDRSQIFLLRKGEVLKSSYSIGELTAREICRKRIEQLF